MVAVVVMSTVSRVYSEWMVMVIGSLVLSVRFVENGE